MITRTRALAIVKEQLGDCRRCPLHETRTNIVFGVGRPDAHLMFIGEGPGEEEDRKGEPFVGRAGQLLDRMIAAMGYTRDSVYIGNIVKCRATTKEGANRLPAEHEVEKCLPFIKDQITAIRPSVIVALGKLSAQTLLRTDEGITRMRGKWQTFEDGTPVMPTFHPAFLLRTPAGKPYVWRDLKKVLCVLRSKGFEPPLEPARM